MEVDFQSLSPSLWQESARIMGTTSFAFLGTEKGKEFSHKNSV